MRSPPTVRRVLSFSAFSGQMLTTMRPYVISLSQFLGMSACRRNLHVSGPLISRMPWNSRPNSFVNERVQTAWLVGFLRGGDIPVLHRRRGP